MIVENTVASFGLALSALALAFAARLWLELRRDQARFKMFAARDRLYLAVAAGHLAPDHPLFRSNVAALNSCLRSAGYIGAKEYLSIVSGREGKEQDLSGLSASAREALHESYLLAGEGLLELLLLNSRMVRVLRRLDRLVHRLGRYEQAREYQELNSVVTHIRDVRARTC